jgi:uncharacterized membrane protein YvbJ
MKRCASCGKPTQDDDVYCDTICYRARLTEENIKQYNEKYDEDARFKKSPIFEAEFPKQLRADTQDTPRKLSADG